MTKEEIIEWLRNYIANVVDLPPAKIEQDVIIVKYGLDSMSAASLLADLGDVTGVEIDEADIYVYNTVETLAGRVFFLIRQGKSV